VAQDGKGPILRSFKHDNEPSDTRKDEKFMAQSSAKCSGMLPLVTV